MWYLKKKTHAGHAASSILNSRFYHFSLLVLSSSEYLMRLFHCLLSSSSILSSPPSIAYSRRRTAGATTSTTHDPSTGKLHPSSSPLLDPRHPPPSTLSVAVPRRRSSLLPASTATFSFMCSDHTYIHVVQPDATHTDTASPVHGAVRAVAGHACLGHVR